MSAYRLRRFAVWFFGLSLILGSVQLPSAFGAPGSSSSRSSSSSGSSSGGVSRSGGSSSSSSGSHSGNSYSSGKSDSKPAPSNSGYGAGLSQTQKEDNSKRSYDASKPKPADPPPSPAQPRDPPRQAPSASSDSNASKALPTPGRTGDVNVVAPIIVGGDTHYHNGAPMDSSGNAMGSNNTSNPGAGWGVDGRDTHHSSGSIVCWVIGFILLLALVVGVVVYLINRQGNAFNDELHRSNRLSDRTSSSYETDEASTSSDEETIKGDCSNSPGVDRCDAFNPLRAKVGDIIRVGTIDLDGIRFKCISVRELHHKFYDEKLAYKHTDYFIQTDDGSTQYRINCMPLQTPDPKSGLLFHTLLLEKFDEVGFDSGLKDVMTGEASDFTINDTDTFWRHNGIKEAYTATTSDGKEIEYWIYSRDTKDSDGMDAAEFVIIEMDKHNGMFTIYRGFQISSDRITCG
jgi:hypothetical protein